jgi:hypothetical protein
MKLGFSRQIVENYSNFINIQALGAELFRSDGRTDRLTGSCDEANSQFPQSCERA